MVSIKTIIYKTGASSVNLSTVFDWVDGSVLLLSRAAFVGHATIGGFKVIIGGGRCEDYAGVGVPLRCSGAYIWTLMQGFRGHGSRWAVPC